MGSWRTAIAGVGLAVLAGPAAALILDMPGQGTLTREVTRDYDRYAVPLGPWTEGAIPTIDVTGRITIQSWRLGADGVTTLSIMDALAEQLTAKGFEVLLRCAGRECGGFDFRFGTQVLPAPDMFVDLFDYRFLTARLDAAGAAEFVTLMVSSAGPTGYVQIVHAAPDGGDILSVTPGGTVRPVTRPETETMAGARSIPTAGTDLAGLTVGEALERLGHTVLSDLDFGSGAAGLGDGPYASLQQLAAYLKADAGRRVALVGHTDATGSLEINIALSRKRASAVLERLVGQYGVPRQQLDAEGMGYLSPIAPNLTAAGREANRRVEAVLLNTE